MTPTPAGRDQAFPDRPVRVIDPFGAGGGVDVIARALASRLAAAWGQPVIVENHPGAGRTAAPALVAQAPPDGYTLLINARFLTKQRRGAAVSWGRGLFVLGGVDSDRGQAKRDGLGRGVGSPGDQGQLVVTRGHRGQVELGVTRG